MTTRKLWTALVAAASLSAVLVATESPAAAWPAADEAIRSLEQAGVLAGTDCSTEACDGDLLRWEAALWLSRALDLGPEEAVFAADAADAAERASFAADVAHDTTLAGVVATLAREGVTLGCATRPFRFCPDRPARRAEMASFLARAFDLDTSRVLDVGATGRERQRFDSGRRSSPHAQSLRQRAGP